MKKVKEFEKDLELFWHCEARDRNAVIDLRKTLLNTGHPISLDEFGQLLDEAILLKKYSMDEYVKLVGCDFDTPEGIIDDLKALRAELFDTLSG